jgi:RNA polymerase sigma-70 factor (ECF subfamily)
VDAVFGDECAHVDATTSSSDAFATIFRQEFPALAGYCAGLVGDRHLGGDLAQEALVRTWGRWTSVRNPHAYAYLVATNLVRRHWRQVARRSQAEVAAALASQPPHVADRDLWDLVERLPEKLRVPTLLYYYADLPTDRIAQLLHRPIGTIRRRLHEARRLLGTMLGED